MVEYHHGHLDLVFSAVADPTRRAILQMLAEGPATITKIAEPFPVSLNAVSKHVMVLERAGLVRREIHGREHLCRFDPDPLQEAQLWLDHCRRFWEDRMDALEVYVARKHRARRKGTEHGRPH